MLIPTLRMALTELRRNLMRSGLTALGVIIGVASVIAMVNLGKGATASVTADIAELGHNLLVAVPGESGRHGGGFSAAAPFTLTDVRAMQTQLPGVTGVAPMATRNLRIVQGNNSFMSVVTGTTNAYMSVRNWPVTKGRSFTEAELLGGSSTCILGQSLIDELFNAQNPLGARIRLGRSSCSVIGILEAKGQSTFGQDQDNLVLMPIKAFHRRIAGNTDVGAVFLAAATDTTAVQEATEALLRERRRVRAGHEDDFSVRDMKEITEILQNVTGVLTALLGSIAAVSLLVGGIGIMNIMLVSVTERTREIGIRLAVGARARDVLLQFLVEAVVLSVAGGLVGIGVGLLGSRIALKALDLPFVFDASIVLIAFGVSAFIGVLFGYVPARKAAHMDPIEALRYE